MRFTSAVVGSLALLGLAAAQPQTGTVSPQVLAKYESEYKIAKASLKIHSTDKKLRSRFAAAADRFAFATMYAPKLGPKVRYPKALRIYREVLAVDPTNHEAKNNSEMIVSIYKQMHRPVPK